MAERTAWRIEQRRGRAHHKRTRTVTSSNLRRVGRSELGAFLASCRGAFVGIGLPWRRSDLGRCVLWLPWIGWAALAGAGLLVALTLLTDGLARAAAKSTVAQAMSRNVLDQASRRNAEVLRAMGMAGRMNT